MSNENCIKLNKSSIQGVHFDLYEKDFTFVVNDEEYPTNRLIADILSPTINQLHTVDPTLDRFIINTQSKGDFSRFLNLINFKRNIIQEEDLAFFSEIIKTLDMQSIQVYIKEDEEKEEQTIDNSIMKIHKHEKNSLFYRTMLEKEIKFVSSHFSELSDEQMSHLKTLSKRSIIEIISNSDLCLKNEDQLLSFISDICMSDSECLFMYEYVQFVNLSVESMNEFLSEFNFNDLTSPIWKSLSERLLREIVNVGNENSNKARYVDASLKNGGIKIEFNGNNELDGIMRHIVKNANGNVDDKLDITASSIGSSSCPLKNLLNDNPNQYFYTRGRDYLWICFDFKMHKIIPTHYTIKTNIGSNNIRSWRIEGSSDNDSWEVLDQQTNCEYTHGDNRVHTFQINNQQNHNFRYLRLFSAGPSWISDNCFLLAAIDFYGTLI